MGVEVLNKVDEVSNTVHRNIGAGAGACTCSVELGRRKQHSLKRNAIPHYRELLLQVLRLRGRCAVSTEYFLRFFIFVRGPFITEVRNYAADEFRG